MLCLSMFKCALMHVRSVLSEGQGVMDFGKYSFSEVTSKSVDSTSYKVRGHQISDQYINFPCKMVP